MGVSFCIDKNVLEFHSTNGLSTSVHTLKTTELYTQKGGFMVFELYLNLK